MLCKIERKHLQLFGLRDISALHLCVLLMPCMLDRFASTNAVVGHVCPVSMSSADAVHVGAKHFEIGFSCCCLECVCPAVIFLVKATHLGGLCCDIDCVRQITLCFGLSHLLPDFLWFLTFPCSCIYLLCFWRVALP